MAIHRMKKTNNSSQGKSSTAAYTTKKQAKMQMNMVNAQAKVMKSQAKANLIQAKQSRMRERNKTARVTAMASAAASPWNQIINNSDKTGSYQTGTIGETPEQNEQSSSKNSWTPRG